MTGEQVTIREWVEERDKVMAAKIETHREETRANMAEVAREIMREGRQTAVNVGLALAGLMVASFVGIVGVVVALHGG